MANSSARELRMQSKTPATQAINPAPLTRCPQQPRTAGTGITPIFQTKQLKPTEGAEGGWALESGARDPGFSPIT